ncbi:MAG: EamA family transporter [Saprospiraceae bacterium]|nr:EamA family transporter [Saprospiraceae bacterium]
MNKSDRLLVILSFGAIYFIWGSTYLFNKIVVSEVPPFLLGSVRFFSAGIIIMLIATFLRNKPKVKTHEIRNAGIAGILFLTLGNGIAVWSLQYVDSGLTALLIAAQPLVLLLMMWILEGKKILMKSMIGIALGFIGIYLLVFQNEVEAHPDQWKGFIGIFFCLLTWGYASLFVAKADLPKNFFVSSGYQMLIGGSLMMVLSGLLGEDFSSLLGLSVKGKLSMAYLIVFGSIAAFTAFNFLLKRISPEKVATNTYINPVVALILGALVLGEVITWLAVLAAALLLSGVFFINSARTKG